MSASQGEACRSEASANPAADWPARGLENEPIKADFGAGAIAITAVPALGGKR
jgi:hypothetical protein